MRIRLPILALFVVVGMLLVAGCGGSDDGDTTTVTTSNLSKTAYVKRANIICSDAREQALAIPPEKRGETMEQILQEVTVPRLAAVVDELRQLGAPQGDTKQIEAYLAAMEKGVEEGAKVKLKNAIDLEPVFEDAGDIAKKYGIRFCAFG